jgi:hypothetical protein
LYGAIVNKGDVSHSRKHWQVGSIPYTANSVHNVKQASRPSSF